MTKERLRSYADRKKEIQQIERMLEDIEARMFSPKVQNLSGMPSSPSPDNDKMTSMVAKHIQLQDQYIDLLHELTKEQIAIEKAIETLAPRERELLRLRYLMGMKWEDICVVMSYSWKQIHRIHGFALRQLSNND